MCAQSVETVLSKFLNDIASIVVIGLISYIFCGFNNF